MHRIAATGLLAAAALSAFGCADRYDVALTRASALNSERRFDEALAQIDSALASEPHRCFAYYLRGQINAHRGDYPSALDDYRNAALHLSTSGACPHSVSLADLDHATVAVLLESGRFADAVERLEIVLLREPENLVAQGNLALAQLALGNTDKAENALRHVAEFAIVGAKWRPQLAMGCVLAIQHDWEEAQLFSAAAMRDCNVFKECDGFVADCAEAIRDKNVDDTIHAFEQCIGWSFRWDPAAEESDD